MFKHQKQIFNIYIHVTIDPETGEKKDIINFYNEIYIKSMKEYIIQAKAGGEQMGSRTPMIHPNISLTPSMHKPQIKVLCPPSPLRQNLPPNVMTYNTIYSQNPRSNFGTPCVNKPL